MCVLSSQEEEGNISCNHTSDLEGVMLSDGGTDRKRQTPYDSASARTLKKAKLVKMESKMVVASGQGGGAGERRDIQGFRLATSRSVQVPES